VKKNKIIIPIFIVLIVTAASFYPCLKNNFTNWDDNLYVTENKAIRAATPGNLKNISTSFFVTHYQPVTIFSYLLEYRFFKLNPFNYHLTNFILHLLNCVLVFWVIYLFTKSASVACLTAVFFGIHPMQVESVAWVSERKNLLCAFFFLGAMISYLYYLGNTGRLKYYFFCLGLFILALLSKSMAITLPLVLLLLDYCTRRKINLAVFIEKIPYFFLSLLLGLVALLGAHLSKFFYDERVYGLLTKLIGAAYDIVFYLNKLLLPVKLSVLYPYSEIKHTLPFIFSFLLVAVLLAAIIKSARYTRKIIFGSGVFLLTIFPVLRSLPLDEVLVADRYVYLPAIGIFYLFAQGGIWLYQRKIKHRFFLRMFLVLALASVVIFFSLATWKRNQVWKDSLSLWSNVLESYPDSATAYNNRGEFLLGQGQYSQALSDFILATSSRTKYPYNPVYKYYYLNLGNSLRALGRKQEAEAIFEQLIRETEAYFAQENIRDLPGDKDKAVAANRRSIEAGAYLNLADLKDSLGDKDKAVELYIRAIELGPKMLYAYSGLAQIYKSSGQKEKLELLYQKAIVNNLDLFDAYYYTGNLYFAAQNYEAAIKLYLRAVEINPTSKEAYVDLGNAYLMLGKNKEAITWLKRALKLESYPKLSAPHKK